MYMPLIRMHAWGRSFQLGSIGQLDGRDLCWRPRCNGDVVLQEHNFETADERFSAQKAWIQERDREDWHVDKRKRRERRLQKKLKMREAAAETQGHEAVVLGGDASDDDQSGHSDEEGVGGGGVRDIRKVGASAGAYKGMLVEDADPSSSAVPAVKDMLASDQEQLALRLLRGM